MSLRDHISTPTGLRLLLNRIAILVLVIGLGSAALIWHAQDVADSQNAETASEMAPLDSRKHVRDVEINYGKLGVVVEQAEQALQGKGLAKTVAIVSLLAATGLFLFAARLNHHSNE